MARSAKSAPGKAGAKSAASPQPQEDDVARPPQPERFNADKDQLKGMPEFKYSTE